MRFCGGDANNRTKSEIEIDRNSALGSKSTEIDSKRGLRSISTELDC